jgi:hypothetical protein
MITTFIITSRRNIFLSFRISILYDAFDIIKLK